jgi:hypothetical protein
LALGGTAANAAIGDKWVLLCLGWSNGAGPFVYDDLRRDLGWAGDERYLPEFPTKAACMAAERRLLQKYAGLSHAEGGDHSYLCTSLDSFAYPAL